MSSSSRSKPYSLGACCAAIVASLTILACVPSAHTVRLIALVTLAVSCAALMWLAELARSAEERELQELEQISIKSTKRIQRSTRRAQQREAEKLRSEQLIKTRANNMLLRQQSEQAKLQSIRTETEHRLERQRQQHDLVALIEDLEPLELLKLLTEICEAKDWVVSSSMANTSLDILACGNEKPFRTAIRAMLDGRTVDLHDLDDLNIWRLQQRCDAAWIVSMSGFEHETVLYVNRSHLPFMLIESYLLANWSLRYNTWITRNLKHPAGEDRMKTECDRPDNREENCAQLN